MQLDVNESVPGFAQRLGMLAGWRRAGAAFFFGAVSVLAFPPMSFFPVLWLCFPALIFLLQGTVTIRQAFITGWCFAFGCFLFGFYWIAAAMFVDIGQFWWAVPLAVAGLPAFFAIYYGVALAVARRIGLNGVSGIIVFSLMWFLADYARGHVFGGFPWNLEGYVWTRALPVLQITSIIGVYGLTLLTLCATALFALFNDGRHKHHCLAASGVILFSLIALGGEWRLSQDSGAVVPNVHLRIVQPNINQAHKWDADGRERNLQQLLDLSSAPGKRLPTHIIWPETAATFYLTEDPVHRRVIAAHIPQDGAILTGVIRRSQDADGTAHYYNSLIVVDGKSNIVADYDKFHLVPFGEYIPMRSFLPIRTLANLGLDFTAGDGLHSLRVSGLPPFSPLICYEAIFSGAVEDTADRPGFLVNITNDGWYGNTTGPYQHFATVRVRAIEEGLPLVRAANTGISGVVDAYGRIVTRIGLGKSDFADADLPQAIAPTFFSHYGEGPLWVMCGLLVAGVVFMKLRQEPRVA